ncbi:MULTISPECIES: sensor histidine kinase [Acinetobacter]|uniref:sensor histidine kinase n=1 Tax=Acinetobacter TaxID=469 RepID=UPI0009CBD87A|nr:MULTISPECIES: PAS domain-containing sensor histidine kinase [Acinetobacter]MEB3795724.1 PAS domain-containing sensor histidine kinase [Acinetobacter sp. IK24]MEB3814873.1 PAS domain-containing sensor histidine kinase [Acinetobacter sp. IK22]MEB3834047.1 PAS domain-containing sensor histidine kinase [Acinetobacter sp. IK23]MEB3837241.1 PAS domain-containing sensor histidine kinase [Acinetobacter sp. IK25]ONN57406.1 histidine kinase [Acinetobacter genomosp. 33YU]
MHSPLNSSLSHTIFRLGTWYGLYRLIIAVSLTIILVSTNAQADNSLQQPSLYFYTLLGYSIVSLVQLLGFKFIAAQATRQLALFFIVDVICLSLLTFSVGEPNLQLSLLYVIAIFTSAILLSARMSLIITLLAIIAVIYQRFVGSLFDYNNLNTIGNSALLAFLFFVVHGIGQIAVQRFKLLEALTFHQSVELYQLQNINRYILEQIEEGYLVLDEDYNIVLSNPAACSLLGIPPQFANEKYPLAKWHTDLYEILKFGDLQEGDRFIFESRLSTYSINIKVQHLLVPQQALTLLILQDAQQINQQAQQLKLAALGQLSASIAHEIRNPLAAIVQANELLKDSDPEQQNTLQHMIGKQAKRIDSIVQDTLGLARSERTHPIQIDLNHFITSLFEEDLSDVKHSIRLEISDNYLKFLFDEKQLRQVMINLVRNALRHNAPDSPDVTINIHSQTNKIYIDVIDYGEGVSKRDISQLFKPFFSTEINGTGLGLYLSHSFCEANHAKLTYVEQKQGACFRIECPIIY